MDMISEFISINECNFYTIIIYKVQLNTDIIFAPPVPTKSLKCIYISM